MEALRGLRAPRRKYPCLSARQKVGGCARVWLEGGATRGAGAGGTTPRRQSEAQLAAHISVLTATPEEGWGN